MDYKKRKLKRKQAKSEKTFDQFAASRLASPDFGTTKMSNYEKRKFKKLQKTNKQIMDMGTFNNSSTARMADAPTMGYQLPSPKEPVRRIENVSEFRKPENRLADTPRITPVVRLPNSKQVDYRKVKK